MKKLLFCLNLLALCMTVLCEDFDDLDFDPVDGASAAGGGDSEESLSGVGAGEGAKFRSVLAAPSCGPTGSVPSYPKCIEHYKCKTKPCWMYIRFFYIWCAKLKLYFIKPFWYRTYPCANTKQRCNKWDCRCRCTTRYYYKRLYLWVKINNYWYRIYIYIRIPRCDCRRLSHWAGC